MTREEIRDLYLELTDLLVYKDSATDAKRRVKNLYSNNKVKTSTDFKYELLWEVNETTGEDLSGVMFITLDWKLDVEETVWEISKVLGTLSSKIAFPKESDIKKDANYSQNILLECAMSLKKQEIVFGSLDSAMDTGIYFLTKEENYAKVYSIFEKLSDEPLKLYQKD